MARFLTLTPNPALDVSTSVARLLDTHKLRCAAPLQHPGGGGINVARVLHRLGAEVLALYPCGGPSGERLHHLLQAEGVPDQRVPIAGETRESFTVLEQCSGREYRFVLPGPTLTPHEWEATLAAWDQLPAAPAWVVASGSLPPGVPDTGHAQTARLARQRGARMVLDSAGAALAEALREGVWLVKPSLRELATLSGTALETEAQQRAAAQALIAQGQAQLVALSLGEQGAMLVNADQCLCAPALQVKAVGSVGAGDSFLAALVWALDAEQDLHQALATAIAAGSAAVMSAGTALCQPSDVARLREQVQVRSC